jgi:hypothetical protein
LIALLGCSAIASATPIATEPTRIRSHSYSLPLTFEVNQGQTDARVDFLARGQGYTLFLTPTESVFALTPPQVNSHQSGNGGESDAPQSGRGVMRMQLIDSAPDPQVQGLDELAGKVNYFRGNDSAHWRTNVRTYRKVRYAAVYPGVDLIYYGQPRQLEYDFIVSPGADPSVIKLAFAGVADVMVDARGDLVLKTADRSLRLEKPIIYQVEAGHRHIVEGGYVHRSSREIGVRVGAYDRTRPLIIDPVLSYSTFLGGSDEDSATAIAVDATGAAYVAGYTWSSDFPIANALQPALSRVVDAFVAKLTSDGTTLVYATYLGGNAHDSVADIAVDSAGNAYITGQTDSTDFPTVRAVQANNRGQDAFVAKLSADGSQLIYSTYLGGSSDDGAAAIALDIAGSAYIAGTTISPDFPTENAFQPVCGQPESDGFVVKLSPGGTALAYSTCLGGNSADEVRDIAVDSLGAAYVTGYTSSANFPTVNSLQTLQGCCDAFVAKLASDGKRLIYSTLLGGSGGERGEGIALDESGAAYVIGGTSSLDFPTVNAVQPVLGSSPDAFVAKLAPEGGALIYATYLGGNGYDVGASIAVDTAGAAYVTGWTASSDFPTMNSLQSFSGLFDAFVAKLDSEGTALVYSTYLGGIYNDLGEAIAVDLAGAAYVAGPTQSPDFPTVQPLQATHSGGVLDAFVTKIAGDKLSVTIDIKPGTFPNTINPRSHGVIAVAVLSTASFDATTVAPLSVRFGPSGASEAHGKAHIEDVNQDGRPDLILHFDTQATGIRCGDDSASLSGNTFGGQSVAGSDSIHTVGCKKK